MVMIKDECGYNNEIVFVNPLEYWLMVKPIYNYLCETIVQEKLFITFISSFFVLVSYNIVTLTCDHGYLQLLMFKNGRGDIICDN